MRTNYFLTIICAFVPIVIVYSRHVENSKSSAHRDVSKSGEPGEYLWYKVASGQTKSRVEKSHIEGTESRQTDRRMVSDRRESRVGINGDEDMNGRASKIKAETDSSGSREQNEGFQTEDVESFGSGPDISAMSGSGSYPSSYMVDVGEEAPGEEEITLESYGEAQLGENEKTESDAQNGRNPDVPDHIEDKDAREESEKMSVEELKEGDGSGSASFEKTTNLKIKNDGEKNNNTRRHENGTKLVRGVKETGTENPRSEIYRRKDVDDSIEESEYNKLFKSIENNGDLGAEIERDNMNSYDDLNEEKENLLTREKVKEEAARSKDVINRHNGKEGILPSTDPDGEITREVPEISEDILVRLHERSRSGKTNEILSKLDNDIFSGDKESKEDLQQSQSKTEYHQRFHRHLRHLRRHQQNQTNEETLSPRALSHHAEKGIFNGSVSKVTLQEDKQKHHKKHHHGHPRQRSYHHHHHHYHHHYHHRHHRHHHYHHRRHHHYHHRHHHYQRQPEKNDTAIYEGENVTKIEELERYETNANDSPQYSPQIQAITVYDPNIYDPATGPDPVVVPIAQAGTPYQTSTYLYLEPPAEGFVYNSLQNADSEGAVCLDGSAPGYYLRKGFGRGEKRWIIYLQGGAWCESEEACLKRSQMHLGSSLYYEPTLNPGGILSNNRSVNPDFYDWNVAYLPYCDGSSFSGNRSDPVQVGGMVLYFRGFRILNSTVTELLSQRGLKEARQVVFSGTSAGGLAVMLHADFVRSRLPKNVHFRSLADSGFFLDTTSRKEKRRHKFRKMMQDVFKLHDCTDGVPRKCVEKMPGRDLWKCIFPQYFLRFVEAPLYIVNPLYDSWQLGSIWEISCAFNPYSCTKRDVKVIKRFRRATLKAMKPVLESRSNIGLFADSCIDHGQVIFSAQWKKIKVKHMSIASSFAKWFNKSSQRNYVVDRNEYPANPTCIVKNHDKRSEILTEGF